MLSTFFKSMIDQDRSAVVVCGLDHTILYMNPAAVTLYEKWGGAALLGTQFRLINGFGAGYGFTHHNAKKNRDVYMVALRDENGALIGYYEKHESRALETARPYDMT